MINKKNRAFSGPQFIILLGIVIIGGSLRLLLTSKIPYMGDECGTLMNICYSPQYILTHFHTWLTMNWYILLVKMIAEVFGEGFIPVRFLSIITGTGTIVLTGLISMRLFPKAAWLVPAALVSFNPYLISYSAIARVYAVFSFCALLLLLLFLIWRDNPGWGNSISLAVSCLLLMLFNLNGIFILLWLLAIILIELLRSIHDAEKYNLLWLGIKRLGIPSAFCMIGAGLFYFQLLGEIRRYSTEWIAEKFSSISYVPDTFTLYFATKPVAWIMLCLMLIGVIRTFRWERYKCLWLSLWIILPIISASILGYSFNFKDFGRFFIFVLPGILIFSSIGIDTIASLFGGRLYKLVLSLVCLGFFLAWLPEIDKRLEKGDLLPFSKVFAYISKQVRKNDRVVSMEFYSRHHLSPYMSCDERAAVEQATFTRDIFLHSSVPDLLKDTERGRVFLVSSCKNIHSFNSETIAFGDIRVFVFNPEAKAERYSRLLNGFEGAAKVLEKEADPKNPLDEFAINISLSDLEKLKGDSEKEKH